MKQYELKSGLFERSRKLNLTENYIEFENGNLKGGEFTRLNKKDIADFKHGVDRIVWYKFTAGWQFSITFKSTENEELKIIFKNYFGGGSHYYETYLQIIDVVGDYYHQGIVNKYLERFDSNEEIHLHGLRINRSGIQLNENKTFLNWEHVNVKWYYRYFAIFHKDDARIHARISHNEYETETLYGVINAILKGLWEE